MPQGLQVWDINGNLVADLTDRLPKLMANGQVTFVQSTQEVFTINYPGLVDDGTWYISCTGMVITRINNGSFTLLRFDWIFPTEVQYWSLIKQ